MSRTAEGHEATEEETWIQHERYVWLNPYFLQ